jgi:hypothetical protein
MQTRRTILFRSTAGGWKSVVPLAFGLAPALRESLLKRVRNMRRKRCPHCAGIPEGTLLRPSISTVFPAFAPISLPPSHTRSTFDLTSDGRATGIKIILVNIEYMTDRWRPYVLTIPNPPV